MKRRANGEILLSAVEVNSLVRVLESVHALIMAMPSYGGDLLGDEDDWVALKMWQDVLAGRTYELSRYFGTEEEDEGEDTVDTVEEWLAAYGEEEED